MSTISAGRWFLMANEWTSNELFWWIAVNLKLMCSNSSLQVEVSPKDDKMLKMQKSHQIFAIEFSCFASTWYILVRCKPFWGNGNNSKGNTNHFHFDCYFRWDFPWFCLPRRCFLFIATRKWDFFHHSAAAVILMTKSFIVNISFFFLCYS